MSPISSDENVINILENARVTNQSNGYAEMKYVLRDICFSLRSIVRHMLLRNT